MTIRCPRCRQVITVDVVVGAPPLQSVDGPQCIGVLQVDGPALDAHATVCPGPPRGGGEPLPEPRTA